MTIWFIWFREISSKALLLLSAAWMATSAPAWPGKWITYSTFTSSSAPCKRLPPDHVVDDIGPVAQVSPGMMETETCSTITSPPAALANASSNTRNASEEPANILASETDKPMQPSKRATSAIIMVLVIHVMLVVSVVLPLLWFMLGP